ncbi:Antiviral helicase SKI2 [Labeo rohita]|uniref:Antiviral helicase SKI2 n=1 Tax=Labeo rohita TaxID=84645 RepID=A0ABQ8LVJ0_LABRO|nr:Antiviral helicase SKI2 [Labeo rohita]
MNKQLQYSTCGIFYFYTWLVSRGSNRVAVTNLFLYPSPLATRGCLDIHITQTVAPHPGLRFPSFTVLITCIQSETLYKQEQAGTGRNKQEQAGTQRYIHTHQINIKDRHQTQDTSRLIKGGSAYRAVQHTKQESRWAVQEAMAGQTVQINITVQGGDEGGRSQGGNRRDPEQEKQRETQTAAMMSTHRGADGGRSHGGGRADDSRGPTDRGGAAGGGARGGDGEPKIQGDTEDPEDQDGALGSGDQGVGGDPEVRGGAGATEDGGCAGWRLCRREGGVIRSRWDGVTRRSRRNRVLR